MEIKLQRWGNSLGVRIPKKIINSLQLKENDILEIKEEDKRIIVFKAKKNKISLIERFSNYNGENLAKEFEWDNSWGKEIW